MVLGWPSSGSSPVDTTTSSCGASGDLSRPLVFSVISCRLHNRIFDLRSGDMIARSVVRRPHPGAEGGGDDDASQQQKCLVSESVGCRQRIHPVTIEGDPPAAPEERDTRTIFVHDTFGFSIPLRKPGSRTDMATRSHLMFMTNKKVQSDGENVPKVRAQGDATAAP